MSEGPASDSCPQGGPPVESGKRSKRIYILWSVALGGLILTAVFCWAVVVPVWKSRQYQSFSTRWKAADPQQRGALVDPELVYDALRDRDKAAVVRFLGEPTSKESVGYAYDLGNAGDFCRWTLWVSLDAGGRVRDVPFIRPAFPLCATGDPGMGISYAQVMNGLTGYFEMRKRILPDGREEHSGETADGGTMLTVVVSAGDVQQATLATLLGSNRPTHGEIARLFLANALVDFEGALDWLSTPKTEGTVRRVFGRQELSFSIHHLGLVALAVQAAQEKAK